MARAASAPGLAQRLAGKDGELLAEGEILKEKILPGAWGVVQERAEQKEIGNQGWPK